ncbi:MAG: heavy metal translocating P-type ATPase [Actinomycetota bacterium]
MELALRKKIELSLTIISAALTIAAIACYYVFGNIWWVRILFLSAVVIGLYFTAYKGFRGLRHLNFDMNLLVTIAAAGAFLIGEFLESAVVVMLFNIANTLETFSVKRARDAVKLLFDLTPEHAHIKAAGKLVKKDVKEIRAGQVIYIKPGERIPLDCRVSEGRSYVNQSPITGESKPIKKAEGSLIYAGTINGNGVLEAEVLKDYDHSTVSRIRKLVEEAQAKKARSQRIIDRFAKIYTPAVIGISGIIAVFPPLFFNQPWSEWVYRALVVLVISCPCALVISTPVTIVSGLSLAARNGVLVKGGGFLEEVGRPKAFIFDKTGTLTRGQPQVTDFITYKDGDKPLSIAYAIENLSEHHLGEAIKEFALARGAGRLQATEVSAVSGKGIEALVDGRKYYLGNHSFFKEKKICNPDVDRDAKRLESSSKTAVYLGDEQKTIAVFGIQDTLRPEAAEVIGKLKDMGAEKIIMLTGDNKKTADMVCGQLSIDQCYSELMPEDKIRHLEEIQETIAHTVMVGDGINDAPALSRASIGIAMGGGGSGIALESADIALMNDELTKIPFICQLGRRVATIIRQNMAIAISVKIIFLALAAFGLAWLWVAVIADMGTSILVIFNGLRVLGGRSQ